MANPYSVVYTVIKKYGIYYNIYHCDKLSVNIDHVFCTAKVRYSLIKHKSFIFLTFFCKNDYKTAIGYFKFLNSDWSKNVKQQVAERTN